MKPDFEKLNGLVPAIIQDSVTGKVLMLGFMNEEAFGKTLADKKVTFYSRTKKRLWTKGEESGNFLNVVSIFPDCDNDSLLVKVKPAGPVCHTGNDTCWGETNVPAPIEFITELQQVILQRKLNPDSNSYTSSLFEKGINKIAQKVGEEATELVIEAKDENDELFLNEAADLLYHYLVLLAYKGKDLTHVATVLKSRQK